MPNLRDDLQNALASQYLITGELTGGGMARVFVADDLATGRKVVIKVLANLLATGVSLGRFQREVELSARLQHRHIVPVLHAGESGELAYYVMPFASDATLRALMDSAKQMPLVQVTRLATEIASALSYAHRENVVHRDIKPENILIQDGHALVADFGIARAIERAADSKSVTSTGLALGTPLYMSPEQATASRDLDGRSDVYSFACVVFEMLAGEPPFHATEARTLVAKHIQEPPPSVRTARPNLPEHVDRALRIGLAKAPADRFATADEFAEALVNPALTAHLGQAARPRPSKLMVGGAIAAGAIAIAAWTFWPRAAPTPVGRETTRIAVLNFETAAPDSELAVLGRALSADLIDALRRAPALAPLSHAAMRSVPAGARIDSLRDALTVGMFVTGVVERVHDSVRVTARIIDAKTSVEIGKAPVRVQFSRAAVLQLRDTLIEQVGRRILADFGHEEQLQIWRTEARVARAWELRQRAQDLIDYARTLPQPQLGFGPQLATLAQADSLLEAASKADPDWTDSTLTRGGPVAAHDVRRRGQGRNGISRRRIARERCLAASRE